MAQAPPPTPPNTPPTQPPPDQGGSSGYTNTANAFLQYKSIQDQAQQGVFTGINGVLGGLPVAEQNQEYFAVIKEVSDVSPELIDQSQFKVIYLCDSQLNVSKPSEDSVALANINQNFEDNRLATVRVDEGTVLNPQLAGTHKVTAVGSVEPIIGTQIGQDPLAYVTTMSFVATDQLGQDPGRDVAEYQIWNLKTSGYQNMYMTLTQSGELIFANPPNQLTPFTPNPVYQPGYPETQSYSMTDNTDTSGELSASKMIRLYFDTQQYPNTGSGVTLGSDVGGVEFPPTYPERVTDTSKYFNFITINTGSVEGNSRIKVTGKVALNIISSSIRDLFAPIIASESPEVDGESLTTTQVHGQMYPNHRIRVIRDDGVNKFIMHDQGISLNAFNNKLNNLRNAQESIFGDYYKFVNTGPDQAGSAVLPEGFWTPPFGYSVVQFTSDYFGVNAGDKIYIELGLDSDEITGDVRTQEAGLNAFYQFSEWNGNADYYPFKKCLTQWKDKAATRIYNYIGGEMRIVQETPPGTFFINGVTGITASYTTGSGSEATPSVYNYTSSYWVSANNYSSSTEGIGCYLTSSTNLYSFYGGEYVQFSPGEESYNVINAQSNPSSSLGIGSNKKTWTKFGFNPIRLPFTVMPGDFIRFEYAKSKTFFIQGVQTLNNTLVLNLQGQIDQSTVLDNFVIYRIIRNGQYIIMDVKKNIEQGINQAFTGIILPKYPSKNLLDNSDGLIYQLKQANIIEA